MNILVLSWRDPKHPLAGGAEQVMHEHMKAWVKAGHDITFFSSSFKGSDRKETIDGIKILRQGSQLLGVHICAFFWYLFCKHKDFDLVIDEFHGIPFFTPLYIRKKKVAVIQEVARQVWLNNDLPKPLNLIVGSIGYIVEPLFFLFYKNVPFITGSDSARQDLTSVGIRNKNIFVINHGVIIDNPARKQKEKANTIVFLGALAKDKGIEDAIEVFNLLNQNNKYEYWIIGKGGYSYVEFLKEKVKKFELESKVKFWGFVTNKEKFELLARAHVMINPSLLEGWGLVNIEANAMGTPVVAYKSRGLVDSVKHNVTGTICKQNNPENMAMEVEELLIDQSKYKKLSTNAIKWSQEFTWEKSSKKSLEFIESIVR